MSRGNRVDAFFDRHEVAWEVFMIFLALVFVAIGFLPDVLDLSPAALDTLEAMDWSLTGFFALEFAVRILVAPSRKAYMKDHWLDLVAIVPVVRWLRFARAARVVRLLRLARLVRALNSLHQFEMVVALRGAVNAILDDKLKR